MQGHPAPAGHQWQGALALHTFASLPTNCSRDSWGDTNDWATAPLPEGQGPGRMCPAAAPCPWPQHSGGAVGWTPGTLSCSIFKFLCSRAQLGITRPWVLRHRQCPARAGRLLPHDSSASSCVLPAGQRGSGTPRWVLSCLSPAAVNRRPPCSFQDGSQKTGEEGWD